MVSTRGSRRPVKIKRLWQSLRCRMAGHPSGGSGLISSWWKFAYWKWCRCYWLCAGSRLQVTICCGIYISFACSARSRSNGPLLLWAQENQGLHFHQFLNAWIELSMFSFDSVTWDECLMDFLLLFEPWWYIRKPKTYIFVCQQQV